MQINFLNQIVFMKPEKDNRDESSLLLYLRKSLEKKVFLNVKLFLKAYWFDIAFFAYPSSYITEYVLIGRVAKMKL